MNKKQGRYEAPLYVDYIKKCFEDKFPDNVPSEYIIDTTLKYFWKYVEEQLLEDKSVSVFALGKFYARSRVSSRTQQFQYYPKLKFSRHFILKFRDAKGTTTEAEKKELEHKKEFMSNIWRKRKLYMLKERGKLPANMEPIQPVIDNTIEVKDF